MRARLDTAQPADLILITDADAGGHHLDPAAITKVRKAGAPIVMPASGRTKLPDGIVLANGERREVAGVMVEAIAAYDLIPGDPFHAKGVANGYLITLGGKRILLAGVTECVPEIRALKNLDVVFVPMNLPQGRMTPAAVADCLRTLRPALAYPYHFDQGYIGRLSGRGGQPQPGQPSAPDTVKALADAVKADRIEVRLGDWYPAPGTFSKIWPFRGTIAVIQTVSTVVVLTLALLGAAVVPATATDLRSVLTGYALTSWSQKDGLPAGVITALAQDNDGYLWVGTNAGLYRFNGARFTPWSTLSTSILPSHNISSIRVDREGAVWIGFGEAGGISRLRDGQADSFGVEQGLPESAVTTLVEDANGGLWAGTAAGLYFLRNERWQKYPSDRGLPDQPVFGMTFSIAANRCMSARPPASSATARSISASSG